MTPFHDLDHFVAHPRLGGIALSPDGSRLVATVATRNRKGTGYATALWELDPAGQRPARRITRSAEGEAGAAFAADNTLYFTSARPDPDGDEDDALGAMLWAVPPEGGEARVVLSRPGGAQGVACASDADTVVVKAAVLPGATDEASHARLHRHRKDAGVDAILHSAYPVRFWDHDLGPAEAHLLCLEVDPDAEDPDLPGTVDHVAPRRLRDLTPGLGAGLHESRGVLSPDGRVVLAVVEVPAARGDLRVQLVRIDVASGEREVLIDGTEREPGSPVFSPDGRRIALEMWERSTPERAPRQTLCLLDLGDGTLTELAADWDRWVSPQAWTPDGSAVIVTADDDGRSPVFSVSVEDGAVTRLTKGAAAYSGVQVGRDGSVFALKASYEHPAEVVRLALDGSGETTVPGPVSRPELPGRLEEVETTAADGTRIRAWLARPDDDTVAPLLLWIHGGPLGSWNAWSWRWTPWVMVARGYAVLLPDPALSTGYGQDFIERGWGSWGAAPYEDLMAITDAACAREDIDESRTAAMGGSFGGYMANWVAGHTDRFRAIVTHASLWALDQFGPTTDAAFYWQREMTEEMALEHSPHRSVSKIVTPTLVIHGDKDYRVPIGEGLRLWWELLSASGSPAGEDGTSPHRFLFFPQENHWILSPQHAKVWYAVVLDFLAQHVLGEEAAPLPPELGLHPAPQPEDEPTGPAGSAGGEAS